LSIDLRIVFVALLVATSFLTFLRKGPVFSTGELLQILLDFLLLPTMILTAVVFGFLITRADPFPLLRELAYQMSLQQNLAFNHTIPDRLADNLEVISVQRPIQMGMGLRNGWFSLDTISRPGMGRFERLFMIQTGAIPR
jgi:hypothetical protein